MDEKKDPTFEEIAEMSDKINEGKPLKDQHVVSRTKYGFCKNEDCPRKRRDKSAYCGQDK
jgi:hypothetical protein